GHPTCCAVALRNIAILEDEGLVARAETAGRRFLSGLESLLELEHVGNVRGQGMMAAVELVADQDSKLAYPADQNAGTRVGNELVKRGVYTRVLGDQILFAPPLVITEAQIDRIVEALRESIMAVTEA
ncbi:MAG TPA: aminotransferase class III-fold pyridoxal phosphate-dependent enzyme, partial [Roseiflexaceae bacterium]|nr:aminotransferase class III-fold pyridoxal phosphate-dependent enzyme [Roseiflexaceae bacterium]